MLNPHLQLYDITQKMIRVRVELSDVGKQRLRNYPSILFYRDRGVANKMEGKKEKVLPYSMGKKKTGVETRRSCRFGQDGGEVTCIRDDTVTAKQFKRTEFSA